MGLVCDHDAAWLLVDYSLSTQQLYTGLAAYWVRQGKYIRSSPFMSAKPWQTTKMGQVSIERWMTCPMNPQIDSLLSNSWDARRARRQCG